VSVPLFGLVDQSDAFGLAQHLCPMSINHTFDVIEAI
jgi:hypothetical protein